MEIIKDNRLIERKSNRIGLIVYDLLFFTLAFLILYVIRPSAINNSDKFTTGGLIFLALIAYSSLLLFRFLFGVYKQIIRYGNMRALARFLIAEFFGGLTFLLINAMTKYNTSTFLRATSLIALDFALCIAVRITYYYIFNLSLRDTLYGRILRRMLILFGGVDSQNEDIGAVVSFTQAFHAINKTQDTALHVSYIVKQFEVHGKPVKIEQINKGYINRTYRVETLSDSGNIHKYILQRINTDVFPDYDALMDNFLLTTSHLRDTFLLPGHTNKGSIQNVKSAKDGKSYYKDDSGVWRMMSLFDDVYGMDIPDSAETFKHAGYSFGLFLKCMSDVPIEDIKVVIPNFHNTKSRYNDLEAAIAADPVGRVKDVQKEIEFVRKRSGNFGIIADALESGRIPTRICHNDTNLNNILFDNKTHLPVAVIDLDTVMPSSPLYDFGDSMRIGTNTAKDDEKDLRKVSCNLKLYEAYARGYLEACGKMLTREELELLPWASIIITSEDGIRFLMDHINGDTYYNIFYEGQNLDRCRTQLKLVEDMENKFEDIKQILRNIYKELGLEAEIK